MKKIKSKRLLSLLGAAIVIIILVAPFSRNLYSQGKDSYKIIRSKMQVLNQILQFINQYYFDTIELDKLMEGAFKGMMKELDPHSIYIPGKKLEDIDEKFKGTFQGIGIEFDILGGYITVISPVADSPSERAGLLPGDQIIAINGKDAYNITKDQVFKDLRGKKGTSVNITVRRIGLDEPFEVTIIRDNIPIYSVRASIMYDDSTGYIWLTRFSATTATEVKKSIENLKKQGMTRLLFDLRNNSGGYLEQAAGIADLFITQKDTLVFTKGKRKETEQVFIADPHIGDGNIPLVVLVNRGSASASEIVSGAIQDIDRGLIAGETTFGKGLVQKQLPLKDGSAIRITIARYFTPSGRLIQRPYEKGGDDQYYLKLYEKDREKKIDSLKALRPKYLTRSGRVVYGGGGITPDIYIPRDTLIENETYKLLSNSKRPLFNWASIYLSNNEMKNKTSENINNFTKFRDHWSLSEHEFQDFLFYLKQEDIQYDSTAIYNNKNYIMNHLKAECAGILWGNNETWGIRRRTDNQIIEALKYFEEASSFLDDNP